MISPLLSEYPGCLFLLGKGNGKKGKYDKKGKCKIQCQSDCAFCWILSSLQSLETHEKCWNESTKSGKDTASLETLVTAAANTTTEPPKTGMLILSDEGEAVSADPTQWLYSVTKHEPSST